METKICEIARLDGDVLLPPRKRLLAGFKKQTSDANGNSNGSAHSPIVASSSSSEFSDNFNTRLNNLIKSSSTNNPNPSTEEIAELAKSAAMAAVKAAEEARAAAEEKAAIATKAISAAKSALDLVSTFDEEENSEERHLKKNKLKKHVPVQHLYKNRQTVENGNGTDEELARRLHRVINSSPRISKNISNSDLKGPKHKKAKNSFTIESTRVRDSGSEGSMEEVYTVKTDEKAYKYHRTSRVEMANGETESCHGKEKTLGDTTSPSKKRGRLKLKKLPLSDCSLRDKVNPKEDLVSRAPPALSDKNIGNCASGSNARLFSLEPSNDGAVKIEATPTWKCQEFNKPACVKQNKVMQS